MERSLGGDANRKELRSAVSDAGWAVAELRFLGLLAGWSG